MLSKQRFLTLLLSLSLIGLPLTSFAADSCDKDCLQKIYQAIQNIPRSLKPLVQYQNTMNHQTSETDGQQVASLKTLQATTDKTTQATTTNINDSLVDMLGRSSGNLLTSLPYFNCLSGSDQSSPTTGKDLASCLKQANQLYTDDSYKDSAKLNRSFNADSLLSPLSYNDASKSQARDTIQFLSNAVNPLEVYQLTKDDLTGKNSDAALKYQRMVRSWASVNSLARRVLYHAYNRRTVFKGQTESQRQADHTLATRRLSAAWYQQMAKAPPATINREMLYVMAEMNKRLYQQQQQRETENVLLATLLAQTVSNNTAQSMLNMQKSKFDGSKNTQATGLSN